MCRAQNIPGSLVYSKKLNKLLLCGEQSEQEQKVEARRWIMRPIHQEREMVWAWSRMAVLEMAEKWMHL